MNQIKSCDHCQKQPAVYILAILDLNGNTIPNELYEYICIECLEDLIPKESKG